MKQHQNFNRYSTQWAGQFYVAAELCKREFLVSFPLGNARETDLVVKSPKGMAFRVEVKTQRTENFWRYKQRDASEDLFYIFVYLNEIEQAPKFYILSSKEARSEFDAYYFKHQREGRKPTDYGLGTSFGSIAKYENDWRKLPE
jgi:hypothetical protein